MTVSEAQKQADKTYKKQLTRINLWVTPEQKQLVTDRAASRGESFTQYIFELIDQDMGGAFRAVSVDSLRAKRSRQKE